MDYDTLVGRCRWTYGCKTYPPPEVGSPGATNGTDDARPAPDFAGGNHQPRLWVIKYIDQCGSENWLHSEMDIWLDTSVRRTSAAQRAILLDERPLARLTDPDKRERG